MFSESMLTAAGAGMPTEMPDFGVHSTGGGSPTDPLVGRMRISRQESIGRGSVFQKARKRTRDVQV
jgi:hypothetical protein